MRHHPIDACDDTGERAGAVTVENLDGNDRCLGRDTERLTRNRAGNVGAVSVAITCVSRIRRPLDCVSARGDSPTKVGMRRIHTGIDHIDRCQATRGGSKNCAVEGQCTLVNSVETPCSGGNRSTRCRVRSECNGRIRRRTLTCIVSGRHRDRIRGAIDEAGNHAAQSDGAACVATGRHGGGVVERSTTNGCWCDPVDPRCCVESSDDNRSRFTWTNRCVDGSKRP